MNAFPLKNAGVDGRGSLSNTPHSYRGRDATKVHGFVKPTVSIDQMVDRFMGVEYVEDRW